MKTLRTFRAEISALRAKSDALAAQAASAECTAISAERMLGAITEAFPSLGDDHPIDGLLRHLAKEGDARAIRAVSPETTAPAVVSSEVLDHLATRLAAESAGALRTMVAEHIDPRGGGTLTLRPDARGALEVHFQGARSVPSAIRARAKAYGLRVRGDTLTAPDFRAVVGALWDGSSDEEFPDELR